MFAGLRADATGDIRIRQFGEQTGPEIMERAYPLLNEALAQETFAEHPMEDPGEILTCGSEETIVIRKAVDAEHGRLKDIERSVATTELGKMLLARYRNHKSLQREIGGSRVYIDPIVQRAAR